MAESRPLLRALVVDAIAAAHSFSVVSKALSPGEVRKALPALPGWEYAAAALHKGFLFRDFAEALNFIVRVGALAEKANHHPQITNTYNRVDLRLTTHDAGDQVTQRDLDLAHAIQGLLD